MKGIQPFISLVLLITYSSRYAKANQVDNLNRLLKAKKFSTNGITSEQVDARYQSYSSVYVGTHDGLMEHDKIGALPGQPQGVDFEHYAGHVTVDPKAGRALFYYFAESPSNSSTNPLLLWLNGGNYFSSQYFL